MNIKYMKNRGAKNDSWVLACSTELSFSERGWSKFGVVMCAALGIIFETVEFEITLRHRSEDIKELDACSSEERVRQEI